ncbi:MAG: GGDEF domain-containing protein [Emcibacter sp.]|nr:GGDEF domain-containing protein [Emcibacter sp.]
MRVPISGPTRSTEPLRRKVVGNTSDAALVTETSHARNINDTANIMGIPSSEVTEKVRNAIMALMSEVDGMRKELELAHRKISELEKLADQDSLVAISNRRAFVREMSRMISYSQRYGIKSSLVFLDMNDLKKINDENGHSVGDAALVHLSSVIVKNLRDSDIVGRLGGDEFGIILPKADEQTATTKAQDLVNTIYKTPLIWQGKEFPLKVAYGIYPLSGNESADQALDMADKNMYVHKKKLKNE